MNKYYQPSGKFSPMSFIYFLLLSLIAFPILGLIYAYAIWYIPFIYVNFLIAGAFGFAVGFLINNFVIGKGKVRNVALGFLFGILGGLVALYMHWGVWVDLVINAGESYGNDRIGVTVSNIQFLQVFALVLQPDTLFAIIGEINEYGTWGLRSSTVSGTVLSIIWVLEFLIIVGVATFISFPRARQPFCEHDNEWFEEMDLGTFEYIENPANFVQELEQGNSETLKGIKTLGNPQTDHSIFTIFTSNHGESYLTVENNKAKTDKDGKLDFDGDTFLEYLSINTTMKEILLNPEARLASQSTEEAPQEEA